MKLRNCKIGTVQETNIPVAAGGKFNIHESPERTDARELHTPRTEYDCNSRQDILLQILQQTARPERSHQDSPGRTVQTCATPPKESRARTEPKPDSRDPREKGWPQTPSTIHNTFPQKRCDKLDYTNREAFDMRDYPQEASRTRTQSLKDVESRATERRTTHEHK